MIIYDPACRPPATRRSPMLCKRQPEFFLWFAKKVKFLCFQKNVLQKLPLFKKISFFFCKNFPFLHPISSTKKMQISVP